MTQAAADLVLVNGKVTTLDRSNPNPEAVAIAGGRHSDMKQTFGATVDGVIEKRRSRQRIS